MVAYPHVAERLFGRAHAIEPGAFRVILESAVTRRVLGGGGDDSSQKKVSKARKARSQRLASLVNGESVAVGNDGLEYGLTRDGVAIVPIAGVLAQRFDWLAAVCGWTTYEGLSATFDAMLVDYRVRAILLDVESPGGEVNGMLDIADEIAAANAVKPVWAVANSFAASAAYLVAASAGRLFVPRLASVGSIGTVAVHVDQSGADQADGLKYTAIYSGARKMDGWDHAPLDSAARDVFQARVDYARDQFVAAVAKQGRVTAEQALATEAALYIDQQAIDVGLADEIGTFDDALAALSELAAGRPRNSATAAESSAVEPRSLPMTDKTQAGPVAGTPAAAAASAVATPVAAAPAAAIPVPAAVAAVASPSATSPVAAAADAYTLEAATETLELCVLAGSPVARANAFISAKTPVAKVRASLAAEKADAANGHTTIATAAAPVVNAGWDKAVEAVNRQYGLTAK